MVPSKIFSHLSPETHHDHLLIMHQTAFMKEGNQVRDQCACCQNNKMKRCIVEGKMERVTCVSPFPALSSIEDTFSLDEGKGVTDQSSIWKPSTIGKVSPR